MNTLYRVIFFLTAFIMNGCYATEEEVTMSRNQQRSKFGNLTPGGGINQRVNFQLPYFLDEDEVPDPGNYTVQFNVTDSNDLGTSGDFVLPRAEIVWSVGGNSVRRVIDCTDGASISGTAEGVAVNVYDDSNITLSTVVPYTVSIQVAKGTRPSVEQPPIYSLPIILLGVDATADVVIPEDIGAISLAAVVVPSAIGTAIPDYSIRVQQQAGTTIRKMYDPRQEFWVPLIGGVNRISLRSGPTAPATEWQLTLGIDG